MPSFVEFVLGRLPRVPARVLEIGCGHEGGVVPDLRDAGFDAIGVDPEALDDTPFKRIPFESFEDEQGFDAIVAGRVLHHVEGLEPVLDKIVRLAPLLVIEEFAWERIDMPTQAWYERHRRELEVGGAGPRGPVDLDEWRARHTDLQPATVVLRELETRFQEHFREERPYFYRWLRHPPTEALEAELIARGEIQPIGVRYVGVRPAAGAARPDPRDAV